MKKMAAFFITAILMVLPLSGCGTIYKAAMDERSVGQQTTDATISATIMKLYLDDEEVSVMGIEPYTFYGQVYLVGEYENPGQRTKAVSIARSVDGVKGVTTYLLPEKEDPACETSDNLGILASVKKNLIADGEIWSTNVEVKVVQCQVVLLGLVGSQSQLTKSIAHAKAVDGVRKVKSYLKVHKNPN